jgi:hypothetical protein
MDTKSPVVLGSDLSTLSNEQVIAWYGKHPHPTVRSLVNRLAWVLEKQQEKINEAYAAGFKAHADTRGLDAADKAYLERLHRLSDEELAYLEA